MTVCVAIAVHDEIVFATDSSTTIIGGDGAPAPMNVYKNGNKVFSVCHDLPVVGMAAGMGSMGRASIHALAKDLREKFRAPGDLFAIDPNSYTIEEIARKTSQFFAERYDLLIQKPAKPHSLNLWIGGYAPKSENHEIWHISMVDGNWAEPICVLEPGAPGVLWGGQPEPLNRLLNGYGETLLQLLTDHDFVKDAEMPRLRELLEQELPMRVCEGPMPIQDAIELSSFLVDVTKQVYRFLPGAEIVGGQTDIAVVTRHEGFKWIKRKHYFPPELNV